MNTQFMLLGTVPVNPDEIPTLLTTEDAAKALNRRPQTLRKWACLGEGPVLESRPGQPPRRLKPIKINGRLAWRLEDIRKLIIGDTPKT